MSPILEPFLTWAKEAIDGRLNGVLVNWYDGSLGHYIGRHRDSRVNMVSGAPIVTISFGEERIFRLADRVASRLAESVSATFVHLRNVRGIVQERPEQQP